MIDFLALDDFDGLLKFVDVLNQVFVIGFLMLDDLDDLDDPVLKF